MEKFEVTIRNYFDKKIVVLSENKARAEVDAMKVFNDLMAGDDQKQQIPDNFGVKVIGCVPYTERQKGTVN